jgi:hypothetical protein
MRRSYKIVTQPNPNADPECKIINLPPKTPMETLVTFFWSLVTIYAIYLSFKCNNGISVTGFLGALIFGPLYVAYKLAVGQCFP